MGQFHTTILKYQTLPLYAHNDNAAPLCCMFMSSELLYQSGRRRIFISKSEAIEEKL